MNVYWLAWATAILAALTAILDAGHFAHLFSAEVLVLIAGIITAIVGFFTALQQPKPPEGEPAKPAAVPKK